MRTNCGCQTTTPCQTTQCGCQAIISSDCVNDVKSSFECLDIASGQTLTATLEQMDAQICQLFDSVTNYFTLINVGTGAGVYKGVNLLGQKELKSLVTASNIITITSSTNEITFSINTANLNIYIQAQQLTYSVSNLGTEGEGVFASSTLTGNNRNFGLKRIKSDTLTITATDTEISIEQPTSFQGTDYYVNSNYTGQEETGTATKPFKNLKRCLDIILNRAHQILEEGSFVWVESPNLEINEGQEFNKWDDRAIQIRIRIQSFTQINENIAVNQITYLLENNAVIQVPNTNTSLERLLDMKELVENAPKDNLNRLQYNLTCTIVGQGRLQNYSTIRKGIIRAYGYFGNDITDFENISMLNIGDSNSQIYYDLQKLPSLTYVPLYSDNGNTVPIVREGVAMTGHVATETPNYGVIEFEGENSPYRYSLQMDGIHLINAFEQHIFLGNNGGLYGENGTFYLRRSYQHVNFSTIETIATVKYYKPSEYVYDIYLKEGAIFDFGGRFYTQENTAMNQGGSESFVCVHSTNPNKVSVFRANGGGIIHRLFYNHYFKIINDSSFAIFQTGQINAKNLNINSVPFINIFEIVDETDTAKTEIIYPSRFDDCSFFDVFERGNIRRSFSNITLNSELFIQGNLIKTADTIMLPSIINYTDNAAALLANMPIGSFYKDDNGFLKIVE